MDESTKLSRDDSRARQKRALSVAGIVVIVGGMVAGAILMPQEMARRAAHPEATHSSPFRRRAPAATVPRTPFMRGVCWEGSGQIDSTDLDPLARIHANWISQTPFGWQRDVHDPEIRVAYGRPHRWGGFWGESDEGIEA
ncbi:MAG TPA: hypothetical protein VFD83_02365, partial [Candidatus Polarisedimenticolia bacterium]|nr:hypothetical protein [Candidatus Polarisedimenticolia bacterium]